MNKAERKIGFGIGILNEECQVRAVIWLTQVICSEAGGERCEKES